MKVIHLNCGTMNPLGGRLLNQKPALVVCHCLLIDNNGELILVDTGIGTRDIKSRRRLGPVRFMLNLKYDYEETALHQVEKLGYRAGDVKHIIITHLDLDHAGGIADFPNACVHVYEHEYRAALNPRDFKEKRRYRSCHFGNNPKWVVHNKISGEKWFGFECIRNSKNLPGEIVIIPLSGHTRGNCAVAVKTSDGWLLHAGDAYYYNKQVESSPYCTPGFELFQRLAHINYKHAMTQLEKIRSLANDNNSNVRVFCTHDPKEFKILSAKSNI